MIEIRRQLSAIYCDDVRQEVGNKISMIGCYRADLIVTQPYPLLLPKLCVVAQAQSPIEDPFRKLHFKLLKGDEVVGENSLPEEAMRVPADLAERRPQTRAALYGTVFTLHNVPLVENVIFRVIAETEDETLYSVGLIVHSAQDTEISAG